MVCSFCGHLALSSAVWTAGSQFPDLGIRLCPHHSLQELIEPFVLGRLDSLVFFITCTVLLSFGHGVILDEWNAECNDAGCG